jgi:hypothetical protein
LQERVEKAQSLRDDLAFMIERADTMANRLENAVRSARVDGPAKLEGGRGAEAPVRGGASERPAPRGAGSRAAQQAAIAAAAAASEAEGDERSEAERELLRALQSMR